MSYFIRIVKLEGVAIYHTFYTFVLKARFFICRNFGSVMANDNPIYFSLRLVIFYSENLLIYELLVEAIQVKITTYGILGQD